MAAFLVVAAATGASVAFAASDPTSPGRCLRGDWRTTNAEANELLQRLIGSPQLQVSRGVLTASFGAGEMRYGSTFFQVSLSAADLVLKGTGRFLSTAPYRVRGGTIVLGRGTYESEISKFSGRKGGRVVTVDGPGLTTRQTPAGTVPFTCVGNTLRWLPPSGGPSGARLTFTRVR